MSRESGLPTFRGEDGVWNEIDYEKVATLKSWYGRQRKDVKERRQSMKATTEADWFVVVGSTMLVYPATALLAAITDSCHLIVIDPQEVELPEECYHGYSYLPKKASEGLFHFMQILIKYERSKKSLENYLRYGRTTQGVD